MNYGLANSYVYAFAASNSNILAITSGGVFLSTNSGTGWTEIRFRLDLLLPALVLFAIQRQ